MPITHIFVSPVADEGNADEVGPSEWNAEHTVDEFTAWDSYTPTVTPGTGAITSYSANGQYKLLGNTLLLTVSITITTNGTGATYLLVTLPASQTVNGGAVGPGRNVTAGTMLQASAQHTNPSFVVLTYNNLYPAVSGDTLIVHLTCEVE